MDGEGKYGVDLIVFIFSQTYTKTHYMGAPQAAMGLSSFSPAYGNMQTTSNL